MMIMVIVIDIIKDKGRMFEVPTMYIGIEMS
jgi:hypothetical protein